jgi:hypothetical protein
VGVAVVSVMSVSLIGAVLGPLVFVVPTVALAVAALAMVLVAG